jgi:hypothetical protein
MWPMSAGGLLTGAAIAIVLLLQVDSNAEECAVTEVAGESDPGQQLATGILGASGFGGGSSHSLCDDAAAPQDLLPVQNTWSRQKMVSDKKLSRRRDRFGS